MEDDFLLLEFKDEWGNENEDDPLLDEELDDYEYTDTEENGGDQEE